MSVVTGKVYLHSFEHTYCMRQEGEEVLVRVLDVALEILFEKKCTLTDLGLGESHEVTAQLENPKNLLRLLFVKDLVPEIFKPVKPHKLTFDSCVTAIDAAIKEMEGEGVLVPTLMCDHKQEPLLVKGLLIMGAVLRQKGKYDDAVNMYIAAFKFTPTSSHYHELCKVYSVQGVEKVKELELSSLYLAKYQFQEGKVVKGINTLCDCGAKGNLPLLEVYLLQKKFTLLKALLEQLNSVDAYKRALKLYPMLVDLYGSLADIVSSEEALHALIKGMDKAGQIGDVAAYARLETRAQALLDKMKPDLPGEKLGEYASMITSTKRSDDSPPKKKR